MDDPAKCVVLVPVGGGGLVADCDAGLRALEKLGYPVRRVYGYADIAAARSQMATDALADGFEELSFPAIWSQFGRNRAELPSELAVTLTAGFRQRFGSDCAGRSRRETPPLRSPEISRTPP